MRSSKNAQKNVLVIGMLDSVHFSRWLSQFEEDDINFTVFASKKFKNLSSGLHKQLGRRNNVDFKIYSNFPSLRLVGYWDYLKYNIVGKCLKYFSREQSLSRLINKRSFDFIHCVEIQGAGYLLNFVDPSRLKFSKVIMTNWGSDLFYFKDFDQHRTRIERCLSLADLYSAECFRDYKIARSLGFKGADLPCIPNAGGFELSKIMKNKVPPSKRTQIIVKGYGGLFGRAQVLISLIPHLVERFPEITFYMYSVTDDVLKLISDLPNGIRSKIIVRQVSNPVPHKELLEEFSKSRVYIGCSISDGISTSFLESLICGSYPIQTNTSCANEWIELGAIASSIPLNSEILLKEILKSLSDDAYVDVAAIENRNIAERYLSKEVIKLKATEFYRA